MAVPTTTAAGNIPVAVLGQTGAVRKKVAVGAGDANTAGTVLAGASNTGIALIGLSSSAFGSAGVITFYSGSTIIGCINVASGACASNSINGDIISGIVAAVGEDFKVASSVASVDLYVSVLQSGNLVAKYNI